MPRDIRSYFTKTPATKPEEKIKPLKKLNKRVISSDEDEGPTAATPVTAIPINAQKEKDKKAVKTTVKKHALISDSDEDDNQEKKNHAVTKKKKLNKIISLSERDKEPKSSKSENAKTPDNKSKKDKLNSSTADNIKELFSKTPIKRVNGPKIPEKKIEKANNDDDDDAFMLTLNQLDTEKIEDKYFNDKIHVQESSKRKKDHRDDDNLDHDEEILPKKIKLASDNINEKNKVVAVPKVKQTVAAPASTAGHSKKIKHELVVEKIKPDKKPKDLMHDDEEIDPYKERMLKKKHNAAAYQDYLQRGGARNPGSKEIPNGAENCLAGLSFVITGVLDSLERFEADELIKKYGGRVVAALSKKVNYLIVGDKPGETKITKAEGLKIKQISEDDLLELIRTRPAGKSTNIIPNKIKKNKSPKKESSSSFDVVDNTEIIAPLLNDNDDNKDIKKVEKQKSEIPFDHTEALVEKYRPKTMKQIIGQQTDKSNAKKLYIWLKNWHKNHNKNVKPVKPSLYAKNDDGSFFKACLLSGPPGIGKTTTVQVVCKELGYDLLEFNASDTRSKKLLKEEISSIINNVTVKDYFIGNNKNSTTTNTKMSFNHVLLMDEVDGMAGREDSGGLQELIALIKSTEIPIVCICNDRKSTKMKTLVNYTFELSFQKPKLEQIRGAMRSLCWAEKITISSPDLDRLIELTDRDIRQVINYLAMRTGESTVTGNTDNNANNSNKIVKDVKLTPWIVVEKVFSAEEHKNMSIHDKSNLFFQDYSIGPLFVQENYLTIVPKAPKSEILDRIAASAESLSIGDIVENTCRGKDAWSLLPLQACYSSVIPGTLMAGNATGRMNFPSWLGRNSKAKKFNRLLQEITVHTRIITGASKEAVTIDYLKPMRDAVIRPLVINGSEGVEKAIEIMLHYNLLKEDIDSLVEVSLWPGQRDPMQSVESKVKAAFTRMYNKKSTSKFAAASTIQKKKTINYQGSQESGFVDSGGDEGSCDDSDENDDNLETDRMIKVKKLPNTSSSAGPSAGGKGKTTGRGRGRGQSRGRAK